MANDSMFDRYEAATAELATLEKKIESVANRLAKRHVGCKPVTGGVAADDRFGFILVLYFRKPTPSQEKLAKLEDAINEATGFERVEFYPLGD